MTGYFDPSKETRRRGGPRGNRNSETDEGLLDNYALEEPSTTTSHDGTCTSVEYSKKEEDNEELGRLLDRRAVKKRKASVTEENRPPTPTESNKI